MIAFRSWCEAGGARRKSWRFSGTRNGAAKKKKVSVVVVVWGKFGSAGVIIDVSEDDHVRDR